MNVLTALRQRRDGIATPERMLVSAGAGTAVDGGLLPATTVVGTMTGGGASNTVTGTSTADTVSPASIARATAPRDGAPVTLTSLQKRYGAVVAVQDVSLDIAAGEFLTLLGPSGSGKSTTLMMIAGFESPDEGDITIDSRSVVTVAPHRRNIGMVFQNYALFPHLTVAENIGFPLKQRGTAKPERTRMVDAALDMMRLPGLGQRYPRQLSGGQQQRVALARAIVFRPRLLLMDEPLGALDKQLRTSLQMELRRLHADLGITFITVTHDQEEALTMSDRIAVMNEGHIAQLGTPEALYDRPANRFVASFLGESNFLEGIVLGEQDGLIIADCAGRKLRAIAASKQKAGGKVTLTMRPERLRFADGTATPSANRIRATVTESVFAGERCRYLLHTENGTPVVLKEPSGAATNRRRVGETTDIVWSAADTVIV